MIIGTAGHIDHGKTTLIKALTGRSTDTLREEIKRGISINLGFTYFDLPSGARAGIIDVPGHERFIKNMLAGAMGIDLVLLTVAANEGVMPQTAEHVDILEFLDIKSRIIVLTKCGIVDDIMRELVTDDIRERLSGTAFAGARIIETDSITGYGLNELTAAIDACYADTRNSRVSARMPIDRIFSLKGFGTVVTGTLWEGSVSAGDELMVYPQGKKARVRSVQVHEQSAQTAYAGQRVALNLPDMSVSELARGDVLAKPGSLTPSAVLDARLRLVPHTARRLGMWDRLRVHMGASEVMARLVPLEGKAFGAGEEFLCQLRLERPLAVKRKDKIIIRFYSPVETIGGGEVLDPNPPRHARLNPELLQINESGGSSEVAEQYIRSRKAEGAQIDGISDYAACTPAQAHEAVSELLDCGAVLELSGSIYHADVIRDITDNVLGILADFHEKNPLKPGIGKEEARRRVKPELSTKLFSEILKRMVAQGLINKPSSAGLALSGFRIRLTPEQQRLADAIEKALLDAGFAPPPLNDLGKDRLVLDMLLSEKLVRLDRQTAMHREYYDRAEEMASERLRAEGELKLSDFRDALGVSRKYAMLLLEDFDRRRLTVRDGDVRRPGAAFALQKG